MPLFSPAEVLEMQGFKAPAFDTPVYKYTSSESFIKILENKTLQFSCPDTFQDKDELLIDRLDPSLSLDDYKEIFNNYIEATPENERPNASLEDAIAALPIEKFLEVHKDFYSQIRKTALIFCTTTNPTSTKMWYDYALDDTGICFSLPLRPDFHVKPVVAVSRKVKYSDEIISLRQYPKTTEELSLAIYNWVFSKRIKYCFENEIRTYIYRDINTIVDLDQMHYYLPIQSTEIFEVYFGANCDVEVRNKIIRLLTSQRFTPKKFKMIKTSDGYIPLFLP
jgi:hypothetical protein